jgi:hypothetical protein
MRILVLAILAIGTVSIGPAAAQTYDPASPVCLHVYGPAVYYECRYTSLAQCNASASGRAAQCVISPYFASAQAPAQRHRRVLLKLILEQPSSMKFDSSGPDPDMPNILCRSVDTRK